MHPVHRQWNWWFHQWLGKCAKGVAQSAWLLGSLTSSFHDVSCVQPQQCVKPTFNTARPMRPDNRFKIYPTVPYLGIQHGWNVREIRWVMDVAYCFSIIIIISIPFFLSHELWFIVIINLFCIICVYIYICICIYYILLVLYHEPTMDFYRASLPAPPRDRRRSGRAKSWAPRRNWPWRTPRNSRGDVWCVWYIHLSRIFIYIYIYIYMYTIRLISNIRQYIIW